MTPRTNAPHPSPQDLRAALGRFATGVTIVTTRAVDGSPVGLTVNSFNSVSLEPALVLWSLALRSNALPVFRQAQHFAIHVLAASQRDLALRFATPGIDRWAGVEHQPNPAGSGVQCRETASKTGCNSSIQCSTSAASICKWAKQAAPQRAQSAGALTPSCCSTR